MMRVTKDKNGFTLVELLIVVLILGALASIAVPRVGTTLSSAKQKSCDRNIDISNSQIELYTAQEGSAPSAIGDVINDPNYFPSGPPECPFGTPYELGANGHVVPHSH